MNRYLPYEKAKNILLKCNLLNNPLPLNYVIDEDSKEVILYAVDKYVERFDVPDYITIIGDWAFQNCHKLHEV